MRTYRAEVMGSAATSTGWWLYFGLLGLHVATAPWLERLDPAGWASWMLAGAGLLALWGYLRNRPLGWRPLWIAYFIALLLGVAHDTSLSLQGLRAGEGIFWLIGVAIGLAINVPLLWASWRYAFRSTDIWRRHRHS